MSSKQRKTAYASSRRKRNSIFAFLALLAVALVVFDNLGHNDTIPVSPANHSRSIPSDIKKYHTKLFTVINVVDGDTVDIDIPDANKPRTRIRLWGIDTPETKHPRTGTAYFGPQAADFAASIALGKRVTIFLDEKRTRGKYGRLLAYIQLPDRRFLNEVLISEGFAYADLRFKHDFFYKYTQLEAAARSTKKGLWKNVTRDQLPRWLQRKKPTLLKKK